MWGPLRQGKSFGIHEPLKFYTEPGAEVVDTSVRECVRGGACAGMGLGFSRSQS